MPKATATDTTDLASLPPDDLSEVPPIGGVESTLINADEELIRTADVATLQADRSQREVDRWRLEASAQLHCLTKVRREKALLVQEIMQLEKNLEEARTAAALPTVRDTGPTLHRGRVELGDASDHGLHIMPGTFALQARGSGGTAREIELHYLIGRAIASLDSMQAGLSALRQQHADLWHRKRGITEDTKRLRVTYQRQEKQNEELLQQKLFLKAAEADPTFRKALQKRTDLNESIRHATDCRAALKQSRMERAAMIAHLLDGAMSRERSACKAHEKVAKTKGFSDHPMYSMLMTLQQENTELRAKYLQMVRSSEEEDVVLSEYLDVLEERLLLELRT
ncbi:hypothetical protein TraAM80_01486 [Trypanosoma rangeli]|uniref:Uncharacterized protein n=1 Tax=Trypanosoma rangeli TaxID=5698 RepID=A0A422NYR1_TRYRA|nr:uncharacterized protein TraAM80_01486 [Trypanosoma rangeli]RNF10561.1 hypothetical protein TraAM80_01486 [Trypanosoma rangeli]|eukprot:RNF10561.1 hypothetical protein TraAM80_01486 [Trypanosoma rangeli]